MLNFQFFSPPAFKDLEVNRTANLMYLVLLFNGVFILLLLVIFPLLGFTNIRFIAPIVSSLIIYIGLYALLKTGRVNLSAILFVVISWISITTVIILYGGVQTPFLFLYFVTIIISSVVLRARRAIGIYMLVLLSALVMSLLENTGILPVGYQAVLVFTPLIILGTNLVVMVGVIYLSNRSFRQALNQSLRSEKKLEEANIELEKTLNLYKSELVSRQEAENEIRNLNNELLLAYDTTLEGWARALELRDKETEGHSRRVTELTWKIAKKFGVPKEDLTQIRYGALLHDIGKMGIPDDILHKPGPLTDEEKKIVQKHPILAYNLLKQISFLQTALEIPYCHHEKWDGTGYPQKLKGEEIPLSARIFAVADVFDAITSDRPYQKAWPKTEAIEYIQKQSGAYFDPDVVEVFLSIIQRSD